MAPNDSRWSILIADDDDALRLTLRDVFEPRGFQTFLAATGREVIEIVRLQPIHCLLLDVDMPELTGLEALSVVRKMLRRLPCVMLTADANQRVLHQASQLEVFRVLPKPVSRETVTGAVRGALQLAYPTWE